MPRAILHVDLDAFFASVEELLRPELRGTRIIVGGDGSPDGGARGVVSSASYPARQFGVRSAMPLATARRLCPDAVVLPVRHDLYARSSRRVMELLRQFSPVVEQVSIDEAFLDLAGGSWERAVGDARAVREAIRLTIGLSASVGLATSKLVAKIASDERKPAGMTVVPPGTEAAFLAPLPVERLWGVGPRTAGRLHEIGLRRIGDLAAAPEPTLRRAMGRLSDELRNRAQGIDPSTLVASRPTRSISAEHTFGRDTADRAAVEARLRRLADDVAASLRRQHVRGRTV